MNIYCTCCKNIEVNFMFLARLSVYFPSCDEIHNGIYRFIGVVGEREQQVLVTSIAVQVLEH